ncbi:hypothetical protein HOD38_05125 [archaeon]|jgi:hypothetical protein|nr:hypothetical protein [archaeon]MBT4441079.1 hypothetical protein [archaeon]
MTNIQTLKEYRTRIEGILYNIPRIIFEAGSEYRNAGLFGQHPIFYFRNSADEVKEKLISSDQLESRLENDRFSLAFRELSEPVSETYLNDRFSYRLQFGEAPINLQINEIGLRGNRIKRYKLEKEEPTKKRKSLIEIPVQSSVMLNDSIKTEFYGTFENLLEMTKPHKKLTEEIKKRKVDNDPAEVKWTLRRGELFMYQLVFLDRVIQSDLPLIYSNNAKGDMAKNLAGFAINN